ncbi:MAG: flavodoxin domain-containing protein [Candidatus Odinarchaeota archaeon]
MESGSYSNEIVAIEKPVNRLPDHSKRSKANALIVYATRYGATEGSAKEIARILKSEGFDVKLVNVKKEKIQNISEYDLVIIGSGIRVDRWIKETEGFLKSFKQELVKKKVALFVSSGTQAIIEYVGTPEEIGRARRKYLEEKAAKYDLQPISMRVFGGIWDYNSMPFWSKKAMQRQKEKINDAGIKETKSGVYDTRNWEDVRYWAKELVELVNQQTVEVG